jgi:hypothetical protein
VLNRGDHRESIFKDDRDRQTKGDAGKVKMARRLRAETLMTVAWIGERLRLGSRNDANLLLRQAAG